METPVAFATHRLSVPASDINALVVPRLASVIEPEYFVNFHNEPLTNRLTPPQGSNPNRTRWDDLSRPVDELQVIRKVEPHSSRIRAGGNTRRDSIPDHEQPEPLAHDTSNTRPPTVGDTPRTLLDAVGGWYLRGYCGGVGLVHCARAVRAPRIGGVHRAYAVSATIEHGGYAVAPRV
jgi:hypothetical protein